MNCTRIREQLPSLLDDRLATAAAREIRAHLAGCPECEQEFTTLSQTLRALDAMPAPTPTPRLRARVYAAIAAEQHALRTPAPANHPVTPPAKATGRSLWFWLVQPLAAAALLVLGFTLGNRNTGAPAAQTAPVAQPVAADAATQLTGHAVGKRLPELQRMGLVQPTGRTVPSESGRQEREWRRL